MRTIARSTISDLLDRLPRLGADCSTREFEVDLFRLIDARNVQRANRTKMDVLEQENHPSLIDDMTFEDWASETPSIVVTRLDENNQIEADTACFGYIAPDGSFVERPELELIPSYTRNTEDAMQFKACVFLSHLLLSITEVEGKWGSEYRVALLLPFGETAHDYLADTLPHAIVGVVLRAMLRECPYPPVSYKLVD